MSARLPSRWPSAAALLAAGVLTSAAVAQSPDPLADPPVRRTPQTAPAPAPTQFVPARLYVEPLLLEEEQVSEHGDRPHAAPPVMPAPPRVFRSCGLPECDRDDDKMAPEEVTLRCLLFTINPLAAFLPLRVDVETETLPSPAYLQHPPQYIPPSPAFPPVREGAERLEAMPIEVERLDVMPVEEESETHYELLAPWTDYTRLFKLPTWPLAELKVSVQEAETGSLLFGVGAEVSRTGTITFTAEPLSEVKAEVTAPPMVVDRASRPCEKQVLLRCTLASVNRAAAREIGLGFLSRKNEDRPPIILDNGRSALLIKALRANNQAKILAEPALVTLSGRPATFTTAGDSALLMPAGVGLEGVTSQPFSLVLTFTPSATDKDRIRLTLDTTATTSTVTDGLDSRKGNTEVEIRAGQTFALGGLLPADPGVRRRTSIFGWLPLAGELFHDETTSPLDSDLVLLVTPELVEPQQAAPAARIAPGGIPQMIFDFGNAVRGCLELFGVEDESSRPMPQRVLGGIAGDDGETVHDLLVKCQRELSRDHYAAAEDLAQRAIERDRKQVAADPLVRESGLLQRVKAIASLPLGTVDPCAAKGAGGGLVPTGAAKAIGSDERIVEALMQEFNTAYQQGQYREAEVLAESARKLDPDNAAAVAALKLAALHISLPQHAGPAGRIVATWTVQSRNDFKEGRYEEARNAALQALSVAPGDPTALALVRLAAEALARQPRPEPVPQCTYVGTNVRPILPPVDPAVVGALQKILIEGDKGGPFGGTEEAEPKDDGSKPAPRR